MFKRVLLFITALCLIFSFAVYAENKDFSINAQDGFFSADKDKEKICEILGLSMDEFSNYCSENGIKYFAVNEDNSKQIRLSIKSTDFSNAVINISSFSDDKIVSLLPDMVGIENVRGEVLSKNGQKFAKVQLKSNDSGGEYILTEYITVADRKSYVLSFYTAADADNGYIEKTFDTFVSESFIADTAEDSSVIGFILPFAVIIFAAVCVVILITIISDILRSKKNEQ